MAQFDTSQLQRWVARWQAGDRTAADELLQQVGQRLEHLSRKMLRGLPALRGWVETGDLFQDSVLRLLDTLRKLQPNSTIHFFNLAAVHIRRQLLDLARHFSGKKFAQLLPTGGDDQDLSQAAQRVDRDLERWCLFHEAVEQLAAEEREVVGLVFYHGWTQGQIAELFQVDQRTVRRRWQAACLRLNELVGNEWPRP